MSYIKGDSKKEQKHFDFLEDLRQSGITNMWGATPYLRKAFPRDFPGRDVFIDNACTSVLSRWMKLHDDPTRIMEKK